MKEDSKNEEGMTRRDALKTISAVVSAAATTIAASSSAQAMAPGATAPEGSPKPYGAVPGRGISYAAPTLFYVDVVRDYGAAGNANRVYDGAMNGSTGVLTCSTSSPFLSTDVGKSIGVVGAGSAGVNLLTTIASYQSASQVTLTASSATAVRGAHVVYGADDTPAFQAAMNAVGPASISLHVPSRRQYFIAGALQNTLTTNAQVQWPAINYSNTPEATIDIWSDTPASYSYWTGGLNTDQKPTAVIHSLMNGNSSGWSGAAIFGGGRNDALPPGSAVIASVRNIIIRTYPNPSISAINGQNLQNLWVDGVSIDTGETGLSSIALQTNQAFGVAWPQTDNANNLGAGFVTVTGFYTGFRWYELFHGRKVSAFSCVNGVEVCSTYHASYCDFVLTALCKNGIVMNSSINQNANPPNVHSLVIGLHDVEHDTRSTGLWYQGGYDLLDASNYIHGKINWITIQTSLGNDHTYRKSGGRNVTLTDISA